MALQKTEEHNNSGVFYDYHRIAGGEFNVTNEGLSATLRIECYKDTESRRNNSGPVTTKWVTVAGDDSLLAGVYLALKTGSEFYQDAVDIDPDKA